MVRCMFVNRSRQTAVVLVRLQPGTTVEVCALDSKVAPTLTTSTVSTYSDQASAGSPPPASASTAYLE